VSELNELEEKYQKMQETRKKKRIMDCASSIFKYSISLILDKKIKISGKESNRILLVSDLDYFQQKWENIRYTENYPSNLEKENLKIFLIIYDTVIVELLEKDEEFEQIQIANEILNEMD